MLGALARKSVRPPPTPTNLARICIFLINSSFISLKNADVNKIGLRTF